MTGFLKWITFLFGAAQALGLRKVRGEAWQGFKRPAKPEVTHTHTRGSEMEMTQLFKTHILYVNVTRFTLI